MSWITRKIFTNQELSGKCRAKLAFRESFRLRSGMAGEGAQDWGGRDTPDVRTKRENGATRA